MTEVLPGIVWGPITIIIVCRCGNQLEHDCETSDKAKVAAEVVAKTGWVLRVNRWFCPRCDAELKRGGRWGPPCPYDPLCDCQHMAECRVPR